LGLRYLLANMGPLGSASRIVEFTIHERPTDIVERLLEHDPAIVGFGVYIWNLIQTTEVVALLKALRPDLRVVLGGPEVSHEYQDLPILAQADYLITGQADLAFGQLCAQILQGRPPAQKVLHPAPVTPNQLQLPYRCYTDQDIAHRVLYVEASRGCPFRCEFCLSALDKAVQPFDLDRLLDELQRLYERGARRFKFVDRTFNLRIDDCLQILEFFLERLGDGLFLHFELIPDRLPERLKAVIARFPEGTLQFEVGVQSFNPAVQQRISRRQDNRKTEQNLHWLRRHSGAHVHADLIIGLPGEDLASFAAGLDRLVSLEPHEIQLGLLKRLRGTPVARHTDEYRMVYQPFPPYTVLSNSELDFATLQRLGRLARYWDLVINSGRFGRCRPLLLGDQPFARFLRFSDWLFALTGQTHRIRLERLLELVYRALIELFAVAPTLAAEALWEDYCRSGLKSVPTGLRHIADRPRCPPAPKPRGVPARQARHLKN
jgi:radical SAM superfamily enzyme YgiQ (UPF0313 family)